MSGQFVLVSHFSQVFYVFFACKPATKEISYEDLKVLLEENQNLLLIDVRTKEELVKGRIPGSVHIPGVSLTSGKRLRLKNFPQG